MISDKINFEAALQTMQFNYHVATAGLLSVLNNLDIKRFNADAHFSEIHKCSGNLKCMSDRLVNIKQNTIKLVSDWSVL